MDPNGLWQREQFALSLRLGPLFSAVQGRFAACIEVLQMWLPSPHPACTHEWTLYASPLCGFSTDSRYQQFRIKSCHYPVAFRQSMTGRVWKTGAVQVAQNLKLVPPTMHPRVYLDDADLERLGEALYIPVYDQLRPSMGVVTVLEALLPAHSPEPVIAADLLSFISMGLLQLRLTVSNPVPQPIKRSALSGRRARPPADSAPELPSPETSPVGSPAGQGLHPDSSLPQPTGVRESQGMPRPAVAVQALSSPAGVTGGRTTKSSSSDSQSHAASEEAAAVSSPPACSSFDAAAEAEAEVANESMPRKVRKVAVAGRALTRTQSMYKVSEAAKAGGAGAASNPLRSSPGKQ